MCRCRRWCRPQLASLTIPEFVARLPELDAGFASQAAAAAGEGKTLRYVAELKDGKAAVGLQAVPLDSALGQLRGNDNLVAYHTRYYPDTPLVLQGRGAGWMRRLPACIRILWRWRALVEHTEL